MKVSEIFCSIQGEGLSAGTPAVFLRMALCNLACAWCDTKYTWDWKNYEYGKEVKEVGIEDVKAGLLRYGVKHLVLTGGEPMLQQSDLVPLLESLKEIGFFIEVETNGTISPTIGMVGVVDRWNVSPKLENSGNPQNLREKSESYLLFKKLPNAFFKYVVRTPEDLNEVQELAKRYSIPESRIMLMPEARTREELAERSKWLREATRQMNYLFSTRLQIELWGDKRGV
jgi:organic radical activating enzyme